MTCSTKMAAELFGSEDGSIGQNEGAISIVETGTKNVSHFRFILE